MSTREEYVPQTHPRYDELAPVWSALRQVFTGDVGVEHLVTPTGMTDDGREKFCNNTVFPETLMLTVRGLSGRVRSKASTIKINDEDISEFVTGMFGDLHKELIDDQILMRRQGVLVGYDSEKGGNFARYPTEKILDWNYDEEDNLDLLILDESGNILENGIREHRTQHRILQIEEGRLVISVWQRKDEDISKTKKKKAKDQKWERVGDPIFPLVADEPLNFIPFVLFGDRKPQKPDLAYLAGLSFRYHQVDSQRAWNLAQTSHPIPYIVWNEGAWDMEDDDDDLDDDEIDPALLQGANTQKAPTVFFSPDDIMMLPNGAQAGFIEPSGTGLAHTETELSMIEKRMAHAGARLLMSETQSNVAVETQRRQDSAEGSILGELVAMTEMGVYLMLDMIVKFSPLLRADDAEIEVTLNRKFFDDVLDPAALTAVVASWQGGALPTSDKNQYLRDTGLTDKSDAEIADELGTDPSAGGLFDEPPAEPEPEPEPETEDGIDNGTGEDDDE